MPETRFSRRELKRAASLKNDELYKKEGYRSAQFLGRSFDDYRQHLYAFLIDLNFCLLPVYIWGVEFILILCGVISPLYFDLLFYVMYGLLFVTTCVILPIYTASNNGRSYGCRIMGLRLCASSARPAKPMRLVMRQLFDFGLPMMLLGFFFSVFGLIGWWLVNGLCVLISPREQTIADWMFGTVLVESPDVSVSFAEKPAEQAEKPAAQQQPVSRTQPQVQAAEKPAPQPSQAQSALAALAPDSPVDLHIRSIYSDDGSYEVEEIFRQAREKGMEVISITDHNNARANSVAVRFARLYGVRYVPGVEIDCSLHGERVRILGYYIDWRDPYFDEIERASLRREKEVSEARIACFEKSLGVHVDTESLLARSRFKMLRPADLTRLVFESPTGRRMPAVARFLATARSEQEARDAFAKEYFGPGACCDIRAQYPDAVSVIQAIHRAGGMAVLSAWHIDRLSDDVLEGLLEHGLDGVEVFAPGIRDEDKRFLLTIAAQEKLFVTAGSDYHGKWKPENQMGVTGITPRGLQQVRLFTKPAMQEEPY